MPSSDSDAGKDASRKRRRTMRASADDTKKSRGRPRVDTQDETAQDVSTTNCIYAQLHLNQNALYLHVLYSSFYVSFTLLDYIDANA
jgi:hypothetical protein